MKALRIALLCAVLPAATAAAGEAPVLSDPAQKASYGLGVEFARTFSRQGVALDPDLVARGMKDAMGGGKLLVGEKELRRIIADFQSDLRKRRQLSRRSAAEENARRGDAFFAANKAKPGVVTLQSGLQYEVLAAGTGRKPVDGDTVECRYRATLLDGTEFDATDEAGRPATLSVGEGMTAGLREGVKLMPAGSKWRLFIPPRLAYGVRGAGHDIGPNETLVYEFELVSVR